MVGKSSRRSCIVEFMDQTPATPSPIDRRVSGPLSREAAAALLDQGAALLEAGEFGEALATYQRVVGFDDPEVTAAALLGMAQARYRMDDEAGALATWEAILELPETAATYHAWRNVAAARVRDGDLNGAIAAYREADRRAPAAVKNYARKHPHSMGAWSAGSRTNVATIAAFLDRPIEIHESEAGRPARVVVG